MKHAANGYKQSDAWSSCINSFHRKLLLFVMLTSKYLNIPKHKANILVKAKDNFCYILFTIF